MTQDGSLEVLEITGSTICELCRCFPPRPLRPLRLGSYQESVVSKQRSAISSRFLTQPINYSTRLFSTLDRFYAFSLSPYSIILNPVFLTHHSLPITHHGFWAFPIQPLDHFPI